jgi:hypothetical protein
VRSSLRLFVCSAQYVPINNTFLHYVNGGMSNVPIKPTLLDEFAAQRAFCECEDDD